MREITPRTYVAGHGGMVGSAIVWQLLAGGCAPEDIITRPHAELDLANQAAIQVFFDAERPPQVYLAAAYHPTNSHVIPAQIRRFHEVKVSGAPSVAIWGRGTPKREFFYVDDMAAASVFVMGLPKDVYAQHTHPMQSHIDVGYGSDVSIAEVAQLIRHVVGCIGRISFGTTPPDGAPRKSMGCNCLNALGWRAKAGQEQGVTSAHQNFRHKIGRNSLFLSAV